MLRNDNSNWKKLLGFRNLQEKLENNIFFFFTELNGAPDYVEYDLPASAKKKRKSAYDDDAEVIDLSEEDDEYYNPKKRSRPGPASSKKGKPGPASKKRAYY